jgi:hypothetical protein
MNYDSSPALVLGLSEDTFITNDAGPDPYTVKWVKLLGADGEIFTAFQKDYRVLSEYR